MAYIYKTYSSGGTNNQRKFTASVWVKRTKISSGDHEIASAYKASNGFQTDLLKFNSDDTLRFYSHSDNAQSPTSFITNAKFRDTSAWYHIVLNVDTTQSTQSERFKMWVNGEQITSWSTSTYPTQNDYFIWGMPTDAVHQIGALNGSNGFDGLMSHFHYVQNANHAPTVFGETDSTSGEWKIIAQPTGITYSDQSFWFFKNDNLATDRSGNGNNWSTNGTITKTEDNPSNNFATFNYLGRHGITTSNQYDFLDNGNTTFYTPSDNNARKGFFLTSLGATSGKYYCEYKQGGGNVLFTGICNANVFLSSSPPYDVSNQSAILYYEVNSEIRYDGGTTYTTGIQGGADGDIFGFALDLDNKHWYIHKNGTYFNSGDPTSGSTGTGSIIAATSTSAYFNHGEMFFCAGDFSTGSYANSKWNFGNGYFGTDAVSSAGTNASNNGIFEYDVPSGYTALSTKGLNS